MATIRFFIQSAKAPAGIYVRLRDGRNIDAKAKTKLAVKPSDWSKSKGRPKNLRDAQFKSLDEKLTDLANELLKHYNECVDAEEIDSRWLKRFIHPNNDDSIPTRLLDYFDYYAESKRAEVASSTHTKIQVNKHLLERFEKATRKSYEVREVNNDFKRRFEKYCREENYAPGTVSRAIRFIKSVCYHARANGIQVHYQLSGIRTKNYRSSKIYLSQDEIEMILKAEYEHDYLINARDWLIVCCETAQRVSDFLRFDSDMLRTEDETLLIEFTQQKTNKETVVPVTPRLMKLLDKRNGQFPRRISDQKLNKYIKEVCRIAGIDALTDGHKRDKKTNRGVFGKFPKYELVTTHIGRRSFATNYYGKYPTALLISVTNHSTERQFLEYIGKGKTDHAKQLARLFKSEIEE